MPILVFTILMCLLDPNIVSKRKYSPSPATGWAQGVPGAPTPRRYYPALLRDHFPAGKNIPRDYLTRVSYDVAPLPRRSPARIPPRQPGLVSPLPAGSEAGRRKRGVWRGRDVGQRGLRAGPQGQGEAGAPRPERPPRHGLPEGSARRFPLAAAGPLSRSRPAVTGRPARRCRC